MENVIYFGENVKATMTDEGLKVAGYLVRFTDADNPDLTGDYFTAETDFDIEEYPDKKTAYFNHGIDVKFGKRKLGKAELTKDEFGIWAETILKERDEYEKFIAEMATNNKLGWSSGTAGHLMERETQKNGVSRITRWPIVEASLTHTPAESRNFVVPMKSLLDVKSETVETVTEQPAEIEEESEEQTTETEKESEMDETQIQKMIDDASEKAAKSALEAYQKSQPAAKTESAVIEVTKDEADQPFKHAGEYFQAVKNAALYPGSQDPRLKSLKANGMSEGVGADGGYLVPQMTSAGIVEKMYNASELLNRVTRDPISSNNMTYNAIDEDSRADGSRFGGIQGYWLAEGGTKTGSNPQFKQIDLKLNKVAALAYATDELLSDVPALGSWLSRTVPMELAFKVEDAIYEGDGIGKPLGIMNSPALVSVTRTDASKVLFADIVAMWARRYVKATDYAWYINQDVIPQLLQLNNTYQNLYMPPGTLESAPGGTLLGKPIIEVEYASTLGTAGDITLAALSQYQMIEKGGIEQASSIHVQFLTDETVFRFTYRVDGAPMWKSALTPFKGSNTVSPYVTLTATS